MFLKAVTGRVSAVVRSLIQVQESEHAIELDD
jgi:hypothetical protein